jgi:transketolase
MSNGPLGSAFPQAQGLAAAEAMMVKAGQTARVTCVTVSDGAAMEGEAKEAFAAIPGLAAKGQMGPLVVVLSDNNTKLSGRIDQESFSMQPSFATLQGLGWNAIHLENAHDLNACGAALEKAIESARSNPKSPVVIIAKTIKGIGSKKTAESSSGGHGFPLKSPSELKAFLTEIYGGQNYPEMMNGWIDELMAIEAKIKAAGLTDSGEKIQNGVSKALIRAAREGMPVVSITSDLPGSTGVAGFRKEFPQLSIDVGVAESNMISMAAGMSKAGYIPVVDTFAQFGVTKGALPLTMASLSEAPVVAFFSHTGFQDAADGASHQALSYLAMTMAIPDLDVYVLSCSTEAEQLVYQAVSKMAEAKKLGKKSHSVVFFLGRENFPKSYLAGSDQPDVFDLEKYKIYTFGKDQSKAMILTHGSLMPEALKAAETLQAKISTKVVNLSNVKTFDAEKLGQDLKSCGGNIVVVEDHQQVGGLSQYVSHRLNLAGVPFRLRSLAVQGRFGQSAYSALELYRMHGLDSEAIARAVQDLIR